MLSWVLVVIIWFLRILMGKALKGMFSRQGFQLHFGHFLDFLGFIVGSSFGYRPREIVGVIFRIFIWGFRNGPYFSHFKPLWVNFTHFPSQYSQTDSVIIVDSIFTTKQLREASKKGKSQLE